MRPNVPHVHFQNPPAEFKENEDSVEDFATMQLSAAAVKRKVWLSANACRHRSNFTAAAEVGTNMGTASGFTLQTSIFIWKARQSYQHLAVILWADEKLSRWVWLLNHIFWCTSEYGTKLHHQLISKSSVLSFFSFILVISPMRAHIAEYVTDSGGMIGKIDLKIAHILCISKYTHICTVLS